MSLPAEPPTPPTKTSEKLRTDLRAVNRQLALMQDQWEDERRKLAGENAVLQDATKRLNAEVRNAKSELQRHMEWEKSGERDKATMQSVCGRFPSHLGKILTALKELSRAKRTVDELEAELKEERARLRELTTEQSKAERQKEKVVLQLRRTESVRYAPFHKHCRCSLSWCLAGHGRREGAAAQDERGESRTGS